MVILTQEVRCDKCKREFRILAEGPRTTASGAWVDYCLPHKKRVVPLGVPISLEEKRGGEWIEILRYRKEAPMVSTVGELRDSKLMENILCCFNDLLQKQLSLLGALNAAKITVARQGLTSAYLGFAKGLHAHEMGRVEEESEYYREAGQKLLGMRTKLEG